MACAQPETTPRKTALKPSRASDNPGADKGIVDLSMQGNHITSKSGPNKSLGASPTKPAAKAKVPPKQPAKTVSPNKQPTPSRASAHSDSLTQTASATSEEEMKTTAKEHHETDEIEVLQPEAEKVICPICLDNCIEPKELDKCSHVFCTDCIDHYFQNIKPQCPCCFTIYGEIRGNQPESGVMKTTVSNRRLPGFGRTSTGTIQITYTFPSDIQTEKHPNPGMPYEGTIREAYLPDNREGQLVLELLERAFELRQIFTIGQSRTTGCDNVVTWNDIHHKTSPTGGMENFGYPDNTYLNRVQQELAAKGIK